MTHDAASQPATGSARRPGMVAMQGVGGLLMAVVGGAILAAAMGDASAYGVAFGGMVAALGLVALAVLVLEVRHARRRPGATLGTAPDGRAATVVGRAGWTVVVAVVALVVLAGAPLAAGVTALAAGDGLLGVLLLALGLWLASYLVPVLLGRVRAGGLYLTPDGITDHKDGGWWRIRWDDVAGVVPNEPLAVVLNDCARVERGRATRWGWGGAVRAPDGVLGVQTRHLAEDAAVISFLLLAYKERPDLRDQLGAPESLEWDILRPDRRTP